MTIKDEAGNSYNVALLRVGAIATLVDYPDYDLRVGKDYPIHYRSDIGVYIFASDEIILTNGEVRADMWENLIYKPNN